MAKDIEIKSYRYYVFSSREGDSKAVMLIYGDGGVLVGYVNFMGDDVQSLPPARPFSDKYILYYRYTDLQDLVDMLRNEKPIFLIWRPEGTNNSRISTSAEPVGEGEETGFRGGGSV